MNTDLQAALTQALLSHEKVWADEEKTILAKNILLDLVEKTDPTIIGLLLGNDDLKRHFFVEINGVLVFKLQDFRFFLDKHSVNNSYTKYANRIGLTDGNRFLKDSSDIVLDFPFKDCVLNGGQSTEEGEEVYFKRNNDQSDSQLYTKLTRKRQEIFFNQTLAFDEIDRLFDAKAFSKFSRYTADGKQAVGEIKRHSDGTPAENLIIKGNNLIALHSLAKQFKGKIKLIYIDPPYNTENDSFKYNDKFSHSTWLTFMKNRLEIAKTLLADDGVIFVQIDDNEQAYLKVLMDEIFGKENSQVTLYVQVRFTNKTLNEDNDYQKVIEHIFVYSKEKYKPNKDKVEYSFDNFCYEIEELENGETQMIGGREVVIFQPHQYKINKVQPHKKALKETWATGSLVNQGGSAAEFLHLYLKDRKSIDGLNILYKVIGMGTKGDGLGFRYITGPKKETAVNGKFYTGLPIDKQDDEIKEKAIPINNLLLEEDIYSNQFWDFKDNFGNCRTQGGVSFNGGKKPEQLLQRIIEISTNENDIVLDYHLGSGTTAAVAHKMNRQYIGIEQMNYIETLAVERLKKVIDGEQGGISKAVNWQGGGEFVYAELAPFNETAKQQILACENIDDIKTLFNELCERYFLKYNVSVNEFSQIIEEPEFQSLPLDEQKQMVLEMLDLNQMYVSLSEMDDEQFAGCLNDDDKALSREFYQSAKNQAEKKDGE